MKSDYQLQRDVADELRRDPRLGDAEIGVAATEGVVTLSGTVNTHSMKFNVLAAAERVAGVRAVASEITVKVGDVARRSDTDIAHAAENALKWDSMVPDDRVRLSVDEGWITLDGEVSWGYQRNSAEAVVRYLTGVRGVTNRIVVKPPLSAGDVRTKIEQALKRSAEIDAQNISVQTMDGAITLTGRVRS